MKIPVNPDIHLVPNITLRAPNGTAIKIFADSELNIFVGVKGLLGACGYAASTRPNDFFSIAAKDWHAADGYKNMVIPFERVSPALESFSEKKQQINPPRCSVIKRVLEWWKNVAVPRIEDIRRSPEAEKEIQPALTIIDVHDINPAHCGALSYRGTNLYFYANSQRKIFVSPTVLMRACGYAQIVTLFKEDKLSIFGRLLANHGVPVYSIQSSNHRVRVIPTEYAVELLEDFATSPVLPTGRFNTSEKARAGAIDVIHWWQETVVPWLEERRAAFAKPSQLDLFETEPKGGTSVTDTAITAADFDDIADKTRKLVEAGLEKPLAVSTAIRLRENETGADFTAIRKFVNVVLS